jgi:hypothetical protein
MTWYYNPTGTNLSVYDHEGTLVAEGRAFSESWSDYPEEVLEVMQAEAETALAAGDVRRALRIVSLAAFEDIEEGTP